MRGRNPEPTSLSVTDVSLKCHLLCTRRALISQLEQNPLTTVPSGYKLGFSIPGPETGGRLKTAQWRKGLRTDRAPEKLPLVRAERVARNAMTDISV